VGTQRGRPGILVAEACEFNRSFHHHRPVIGLINNIEEDHLEIYGNLGNIIKAFHEFAMLLPAAEQGGRLLIAADGAHRRDVASGLTCAVSTFGWSPTADYHVQYDPRTGLSTVLVGGTAVCSWTGQVPGDHMALNGAAAAIMAHWLGAEWRAIGEALGTFNGVDRRMQRLGERTMRHGGTVTVFDDYGHHPAEMAATIAAARGAFPGRRLVLAFQPHRYTRTRDCFEDFVRVLSSVDALVLADVYAAGEPPIVAADGRALARALRVAGKIEPVFVEQIAEMAGAVQRVARDGDVVVTMGAGSIGGVPRELAEGGAHA